MPENGRMISGRDQNDDRDNIALRPQRIDDMVGQDSVRENLKIILEAAQMRGEPVDHILFYGPPGLGKTSLAHVIANEMEAKIRITAGPSIERAGDLAAILTHMKQGDILFIDEVHRLGKAVEEILYPAMEDFKLDIMIGEGPAARSIACCCLAQMSASSVCHCASLTACSLAVTVKLATLCATHSLIVLGSASRY